MTTEIKPLRPLTYGNVLIVGAKVSNFDEELVRHPRVILWDSQNEHWTSKDIPENVRAIFFTRWVSHAAFSVVMKEARKKRITVFNALGTGMITKQVKELLYVEPKVMFDEAPGELEPKLPEPTKETNMVEKKKVPERGKLAAFLPYVDWEKNNVENANLLMEKAKELGITTTHASLANYVGSKRGNRKPKTSKIVSRSKSKDVSIEMFDNLIRDMRDMRDLVASTMKENRELKTRLGKFKSLIGD